MSEVFMLGVKTDGTSERIDMPVPLEIQARFHARDIVRSYFGPFEDGDDSDAELAYFACLEMITFMQKKSDV